MKRTSVILLTLLLLGFPLTASAQEPLGSLTIQKSPSEFDTSGQFPTTFQISGTNLSAPLTHTSTTGTVRFTGLVPGSYRVQELATRSGDVAHAAVTPLIVTIPHNKLLDVRLSPKSQTPTLLKSADTRAVLPGMIFSYLLEGNVPAPDSAGKLHRYLLKDKLPAGLSLTGNSAMELRSAAETMQLTDNKHYTLDTEDDTAINAMFTPQGLQLLAQQRADNPDLVVRYSFEVEADTNLINATYLHNTAHLFPDGYPETGERSIASNEIALPVVHAAESNPANNQSAGDQPADSNVAGPANEPNRLASTGASVMGLVAFGLLLIILGIAALLHNRSRGHHV